MMSRELLWPVYEWLPIAFAVDLVVFHLTADHPLALRSWWRRSGSVYRPAPVAELTAI